MPFLYLVFATRSQHCELFQRILSLSRDGDLDLDTRLDVDDDLLDNLGGRVQTIRTPHQRLFL